MYVSLRTPLLAAALATLIAAAAQAQQVHLGRPISLDQESSASDASDERPGAAHAEALAEAELVKEESAADAGEILRSNSISAEAQSLGQPRSILASARSGPGGDEANSSRQDESAAMFGSVRGDALQVISALAIVIGLALALRALMLRSAHRLGGGGRPSGVLEILARYPVARGQHLVLLKLARRILLVHQSGPAMTTLAEISDADEVASLLARIEAGSTSPRETSRFRSLLRQFSREHESALAGPERGGVADAWHSGEVVDLTKRPRLGVAGLLSRAEGAR